jgi:hypothetical protein
VSCLRMLDLRSKLFVSVEKSRPYRASTRIDPPLGPADAFVGVVANIGVLNELRRT